MQNIDPNKPSAQGSAQTVAALQQEIAKGANWYIWIAALSLVNSIAAVTGTQWSFALGLGVTEIVDAVMLAHKQGDSTPYIIGALVIDLVIAGMFLGFALLAKKGHYWIMIVGMVLYALDGLLFVFAQEMMSIAFHGFALFCIWRGFAASRQLKKIQTAPAAAPV